MPDETRTDSSGLGAPAKRGRPRKQQPAGATDGDPKPEGREPEPERRTESAPESGAGAFPIVDPFNLPSNPGPDSDSEPRIRRKRRSKGEKEEGAVSNLSSLLKIEKILVSGAFFLGNIANAPEFYMSDEQSREIGEALREIAKLYPVGMSEKTIAWINLSFAVGGWAGPAMVSVARRPKGPKPARVQAIRPDASVNGTPAVPDMPLATPATAAVPSQMWPQSGDLEEGD